MGAIGIGEPVLGNIIEDSNGTIFQNLVPHSLLRIRESKALLSIHNYLYRRL